MNGHRKPRIARSRAALALAMVVALAVTAGTALGSRQNGKASTITALIGSSGPAETFAVNNAAKAFTKQTGIQLNVIVASDLGQQLAQGFASGNPPDIFYLGNDQVATYAKAGDLAPLDNLKNVKSFYPSLRAAYTYQGHLYAAPKDFSTLALVINTNSWKGARLTSKDYPTTWKQLSAVAKKLTRNGQVGLCTNPEFHRLGVFMLQAGGWLVSKDGKTATVNSKANVAAFNFVKSMINAGSMKLTNQIGVGWGGEGFGKKDCAMTIEGNWIAGAMKADYPTVPYKAVELPAGPAGKGTLQYDGGWGLAAASKNKADAMAAISYLTADQGRNGEREGLRRDAVGQGGREGVEEALPAVRGVPRGCRLLDEHPDRAGHRDRPRRLQPATAGASIVRSEDDPEPGQRRAADDPEVRRSRPTYRWSPPAA